jgi:ribosome-binding factor A
MKKKLENENNPRQQKIEEIAKKRIDTLMQQKILAPIPDENLKLIAQLTKDRDDAIAYMEQTSNSTERDNRTIDFLEKHKSLLRAYGLRPCEANDCLLYLEKGQLKYCSKSCRDKQRSRNWRQENPDKKAISNKKYLNKYYTEK